MNRKKPGFGKQLAELHRWNAWIVVILTVSGVLLFWEPVRGWLDGHARQPIKQLHIALGLVTGILVLLYLPLMKRHLKQLRSRPKQKGNLAFVIALLVGWLLSGIVLWQLRHFPPSWANAALVVHDLFTWFGVPYLIYHSVTRLRWMKQPGRRSATAGAEPAAPVEDVGPAEAPTARPIGWSREDPAAASQPAPAQWMTRRQFLKLTVGAALTVAFAPPFARWLSRQVGTGGGGLPGVDEAAMPDANAMLPEPVPLPDSVNVIGGGARGQFQMYTVTKLPTFDSATWTFRLDGLVDRPATWNWEQFLAIARTVQVSDFHCVTGWSVYDNTWEGIRLSELLKLAGVKPGAKFVKFYSGDGVYTDALSLEQASMDDVLVALLHDGKPIHRDYGGPVRLIVPGMYAYKSVKWLDRIELIDKAHIGYWEQRGYDNDAWVRKNEWFSS
ncbi:molybdopterin-dependent oxidoreductase [Cohnella sp. GCM10027633]|uniref:molybdopterin-dependent oxidoreductase n=1 Tax=unclassified Cohnella TaxID=2636738 RepID=UPI003636C7CB